MVLESACVPPYHLDLAYLFQGQSLFSRLVPFSRPVVFFQDLQLAKKPFSRIDVSKENVKGRKYYIVVSNSFFQKV